MFVEPQVGSVTIAPRVEQPGHVLATPVMINVIEATALAATPVGMKVFAKAIVESASGGTVCFKVQAHDEKEPIGDGTHRARGGERRQFDARVQRKLQS